MQDLNQEAREPADAESADGAAAMVRVDALRSFSEAVSRLGGDAVALLAKAHIDPDILANRHGLISYRRMVHLLERAAVELKCPDFGMRLAAIQSGAKVLGPLEVVMNNSNTVGDAFRYCANHIQAYSTAAQICLEDEVDGKRCYMRFEILLSRLPHQRQVVEQALLLTHHAALGLSSGRARAREVWFSHEPMAPLSAYRAYFEAPVRFGQSSNGLFFADHDLSCPIADPDPQLYELATSYIETRFPTTSVAMSARVRTVIARLLVQGDCSNERVASTFGLHPRTLQRRLREEGQRFEAIKDSVRRDVALRYLKQSEIPLTRVAEMLGYAEASVLSRSCYRWFSVSPRQLRNELKA